MDNVQRNVMHHRQYPLDVFSNNYRDEFHNAQLSIKNLPRPTLVLVDEFYNALSLSLSTLFIYILCR
jgi:hypothetical protein